MFNGEATNGAARLPGQRRAPFGSGTERPTGAADLGSVWRGEACTVMKRNGQRETIGGQRFALEKIGVDRPKGMGWRETVVNGWQDLGGAWLGVKRNGQRARKGRARQGNDLKGTAKGRAL